VSARQVLTLADALMRDNAKGFVATLAALLLADPPAGGVQLRSATDISRMTAAPSMAKAAQPRLALTLRGAAANGAPQPGLQRDGRVTLDARYETFEADAERRELQIAYAAAAFSRVIAENLRDYSDAHNGTVVEVNDPLSFTFGEFEGPASSGFIASISITERSTE
jgi:hypothetical protein